MKNKFTLAIKRYLVNRIIDETTAGSLSRHNFPQRLSGEAPEVMGVEIPNERVTYSDKEVAEAFFFRLRASVDLAVSLKMIRSQLIPINIPGVHELTSIFVTTRFGRLFRRLPSFSQTALLFIAVYAQRFTITTNRFKWLTGIVSFVILLIKVWNSGIIDRAWIGLSAHAGFAVSFFLNFWR